MEDNTRSNSRDLPVIWKIFIAVVITTVISGGGVYMWYRSTVKKITDETSTIEGQLQQQIDKLQTELSKFKSEHIQQLEKMLTTEIEDLKKVLEEKEELSQSQPRLDDWYVDKLKKRGLKQPVDNIKSDLMSHNELIPYKGALGGTMKFFHENNIHILSPNWVLAYFEDGHNFGEMLLEYQVLKDGAISWRVIDSYLDTMIDHQYRDK